MASRFTRKIVGTNHEKEPKSTSELGDLLIDNDGKVFIHTMTSDGKGEEYSQINREDTLGGDARIVETEQTISVIGDEPQRNQITAGYDKDAEQIGLKFGAGDDDDENAHIVTIIGTGAKIYNLDDFTRSLPANYTFIYKCDFNFGGIVLENFITRLSGDDSRPDFFYSGHIGLTAKEALSTDENMLIIAKYDNNSHLWRQDTQPLMGTINGEFTNFTLEEEATQLIVKAPADLRAGDKVTIYVEFTMQVSEPTGKEEN